MSLQPLFPKNPDTCTGLWMHPFRTKFKERQQNKTALYHLWMGNFQSICVNNFVAEA